MNYPKIIKKKIKVIYLNMLNNIFIKKLNHVT